MARCGPTRSAGASKWHDGVPLTAKDIAFTYNYILTDNLTYYTSYLVDVTKVEAPNDTTLVITTKRPSAMMLALYIPIVPEHLWNKIDGKKAGSMSNVPTVDSGRSSSTPSSRATT